MKIIAINSGSSSLKWKLFNMPQEKVIASGFFERIGFDKTQAYFSYNKKTKKIIIKANTHLGVVKILLDKLVEYNIIINKQEISGIGHRIVAGGEIFNQSTILNNKNLKTLEKLSEYAPLHNPPETMGIHAFMKAFPDAIEVGVFDTSFHTTIPKENYLYGLPYSYYTEYKARKYGAHGTSHKYIASRVSSILNKPLNKLKLITMHLGNGSSLDAILNGKSFDTSMGFTPLTGIPMGTRSGDVDASLILYLMKKMNMSSDEMLQVLNHKSGLLGISGISSDIRDILNDKNNPMSKLAINIFINRIIKYIGAYTMEMGGLDVLAFSGGIGENSTTIRQMILNKLSFLQLKIDKNKNKINGKETIISKNDSKITVMIIPTNEELMIAREVQKILTKN